MGVVSSRTPEGDPGRCPVCGHDCRLDPSWPARDGPCPSCGHLLWFDIPDGVVSTDFRELLLRLGTHRFGPPPAGAQQALAGIESRADLEALVGRLASASSWQEALAGG